MKMILLFFLVFILKICIAQEEVVRTIYSMNKEDAVIINNDTIKTSVNEINPNGRVQISMFKNIVPEGQPIDMKPEEQIENTGAKNSMDKKHDKHNPITKDPNKIE